MASPRRTPTTPKPQPIKEQPLSEELEAALDDAITEIEEVTDEAGTVLTPQFTANIKEDEKIGATKPAPNKIKGPTFGIVTGIYTPEVTK